MTTYHRGRVRSPYRKHAFAAALPYGSSQAVQKVSLHGGPADGLVKIKSVRCMVLIQAASSNAAAGGWIGFARSSAADTSPDFAINQSEVFGVQPWVIGHENDQIMSLSLKGITLSVGEQWWLVGLRTNGNATGVIICSMLYAVETTDAT